MALGGADLVDTCRRLDLIDEYRLYVHPVLVGSGRRLFGPADASTDLRMVASRTFGNGVVLLRHERAR
jgi:dihydrofolate reductase